MKITYRIAVENVKDMLKQAIETEGVGFDDWADASLWFDEDSNEIIGCARWHTAFSGYVYKIRWDYRHPYDTRLQVEYEGAERGFRAQNLLPKFLREGEIEVMTASGNHGAFHGSDALERYETTKAAHRKWVAENMMIPSSTHRCEDVAAIAAALASDKYRGWKSDVSFSYKVGEKTFSCKGEACLEGYQTGEPIIETASRVVSYEGEVEDEARCFDNNAYNEIWRSRMERKFSKA